MDAQTRIGRLASGIAALNQDDRDVLLLTAWAGLDSTSSGCPGCSARRPRARFTRRTLRSCRSDAPRHRETWTRGLIHSPSNSSTVIHPDSTSHLPTERRPESYSSRRTATTLRVRPPLAATATAPLSPTLLRPIVICLLIVAVLIRFVVFLADGQHPWYIWPGIAVVVYGIALTTARALKKPPEGCRRTATRTGSPASRQGRVGRDAWEVPTTDTGAHDE